ADFESSQSAERMLTQEVLLRRDVLDALILDLKNRRATRANDLCLKEETGRLSLWAADVGGRAILRRLSRGVFGAQPGDILYDWKRVEFLRGDPEAARSGSGYQATDRVADEVLEVMGPKRQLQVFEELNESVVLFVQEQVGSPLCRFIIAFPHG